VIALLVGGSLVLSGAVQAYASYTQARAALLRIELEQAATASARIDAFLRRIEKQVHWATAPAGLGEIATLDRVAGYGRLLLEEPAVTEVSYIQPNGREFVHVSRVAPTVLGSGIDLAADARFREARAHGTYYGDVAFRNGSEPHIALALAEPTGGVTVADVDLKLVLEVVSPAPGGEAGHAYVVDGRGQLIAHPDLTLVLRRTDLSGLPQVRAARGGASRDALVGADAAGREVLTAYERIDPPGWTVFVERPLDAALAPLNAAIARSALLVLAALILTAIAAAFLARRYATLEQVVADRTDQVDALNRTLEAKVAAQVNEALSLQGLGGVGRFMLEGELWTVAYDGSAFRLRDTKGLHYLAALLREPGRERLALDLVAGGMGTGQVGRASGDTGPILDPEAKAQYRARLDDLAEEIASAERANDGERAAQAEEEREILLAELAGAVGLGGRDRKGASAAERARVNVTRAIKAAQDRIAEQSPKMGEHLAATVRTGLYCVYVPDPRSPFRWET